MRFVAGVAILCFLGGVATACAFWAGVESAAGWAFVLGGLACVFTIVVGITESQNWGVASDHPRLSLSGKH